MRESRGEEQTGERDEPHECGQTPALPREGDRTIGNRIPLRGSTPSARRSPRPHRS
jgi:hypothetical protein